jgi:beta-glucanase (GH16 family)
LKKIAQVLFGKHHKTFVLLLFSICVHAQVGHILWEDDFDSLDTNIWNVDQGDGCPELCGWGNQELQSYQDDNVYIEEIPGEPGNYALVLEARSESSGNQSFTSGKVTTKNNLAVKYGMIEFRIKVPDDLSKGLWPAAWLLGTNQVSDGWPFCGEIDMMEMGHNTAFRTEQEFPSANENNLVAANLIFYDDLACSDQNPTCAASISSDKYYNQPYHTSATLTDRFLTYRMYWDEEQIRLTVDDNGLVQNLYTGPFPIGESSAAFTKPFYLLMNLAVGGNFTDAGSASGVTADLPGKMYIDYVRIKKWNGRGEVFTSEEVMANAGANKDLDEGEVLTLDASGSYGPITNYVWELDGTQVATTKTHEISLDPGAYVFKLTVSDQYGNQDTDQVKIKVGGNEIGDVIWEDNFDTLNNEYWNISTGNGCEEDLCGWGNQELQTYQQDNVYIEEIAEEPGNYALVLEAKKETVGTNAFTSGKVTTENKLAIKYGVVEVRMKTPDIQNGLWPAAWLLGINHREVGWPYCGEIDMMEMGHSVSERQAEGFSGSPNNFVRANLIWYASAACGTDNPTCAASIAFDKYYTTPYTPSSALNNRYVTYRMYWNESQIRLTVVDNNTEYDLYTNPFPIGPNEEAFKKPYYFLLNLAVGGSFTGFNSNDDITAPLPGKLYIDYVRVKDWNGQGEVSFSQGNILANAGADIVKEDLNKDGVEMITLDGSSSYGPIDSYEWSENGIVLSQDEVANLSLTTGVHNIRLKVTDTQGNTSSDYVKVDIRELIWEDNFDSFDTNVWEPELGDGCEQDLCGWGNQELQYYTSENIAIAPIPGDEDNNALVITAKSETKGGKSFTSARVKTQDKLTVKYGLVETRIKVPDDLSTGLWPAFWLLGNNISEVGWPKSGEIDMMEMGYKAQTLFDEGFEDASENDVVGGNIIFYSDAACAGNNATCAASISNDKYYSKPYRASTPLTNRFLTYRMYWDPNEIRLTVVDNGVEFDFYTGPFPLGGDAEEFHNPFFLVINLAVGGNFTDAAQNSQVTANLPGEMLIDYVRVFKWNGYGEVGSGSGLIANAGPDIIQWDENGDGLEQIYLDGSSSSHHSGQIASYSWSIDGEIVATEALTSLTLPRGNYTAVLTITDTEGNQASDEVLITISSGGLAPIANAGPDQSVEDDNEDDLAYVTLDGSLSEEVAAPIVGYKWFLDNTELASGINPTVELSTGVYTITLEVADEDELTATDEVVITVIDPDNNPPTAKAGEDQIINDEDGDDVVAVLFDGLESTDSDGVIEKYLWKANGVEIGDQASFTTTLSTGNYDIELTVTDDDGTPGTDNFNLSIVDPDNDAPVAEAGADVLIIDSDLDGAEEVVLDASASSDEDGDIVSYNWLKEGEIIGTEVEFQSSFALGQHNITLEVTDDDGIVSSDEVVIIVNQLPVADAGEDQTIIDVDENGTEEVVLDAAASYDQDGSLTTYSWVYNGAEISTQISFSYPFEVGANDVTLQISDNYGSEANDDVTIFVSSNDNASPVADAGPDISMYADVGASELTLQLDGTASSDSDGYIYSYRWLDGETELATGSSPELNLAIGTHELQLEVTDNEGAKGFDDFTVTVIQKINIALQKSVTVSSVEEQYNGDLAVDGDYETRWSSLFEDPQWIYVDLGMPYAIDQVVLVWEAASARAYEIQLSDDASNWNPVYSTTSGDGNTETLDVAGQGRFIRMYATSRNSEYGYSLFEFEVYGEPAGGDDDTPPTNLSASLVSTSSNSATFNLSASDDSGYVIYTIEQGGNKQFFSGSSDEQIEAIYTGLSAETSYEFTISVSDNAGNESAETKTITLTTATSENTSCGGESNESIQGAFNEGYSYSFKTQGNSVVIEFELLDSKNDVIAYLWKESPFEESPMENIGDNRFRGVVRNLSNGQTISYACKFAFQGGLAVTEYIQYTVGDNCIAPNDNFTLEAIATSCIGNDDGVLNIEIKDTSNSYRVQMSGQEDIIINSGTSSATFSGLSSGDYSVCFSIVGDETYEQCFEINIGEPLPLTSMVGMADMDGSIEMTMSGSTQYYVDINGEVFMTNSNQFNTQLPPGLNSIKVYTDLSCQDFVYHEIFVPQQIQYSPNPTKGMLDIYVGGEDPYVWVSVYSINGALAYKKLHSVGQESRKFYVDLSNVSPGTYMINIEGETTNRTVKIVKE